MTLLRNVYESLIYFGLTPEFDIWHVIRMIQRLLDAHKQIRERLTLL